VWGAITGVAVSLGPILGGVITTEISWRGIFLVNVPIGIVGLLITWWRVDESRLPHPGRPDLAGFVLFTGGLVGLVYGLIRAGEISWGDSGAIVSLVLGGVLLAGFVLAESVVPDPMFDLALFRTPTFDGGLIAALAMNGSLFAMLLYLVIYLQDLLGYSALDTGIRLLVSSASLLVAATISGRLSERISPRWLIGPGLLLVGIGLLLMSRLSGTSAWTHLVPGLIVSGLGAGLVNPPLASTAIGVVPPERAGMASGINSTFRQIGIAMSVAILGTIFASSLRDSLDHSLSSIPGLSGQAPHIATAVRQGQASSAISAVPPGVRGQLVSAIHSSFAGGINDLLTVTAVIALVGGVLAMALIRSQDFVGRGAPVQGEEQRSPVAAQPGVENV
jgi:predicted MFS family arabinose efflux permease